jgi:hypothetical protein
MTNPACKIQQNNSKPVSVSGWILFFTLFSKIYNIFCFFARLRNSEFELVVKKHSRDITDYMLGELQSRSSE